jgi:hypothetical protein
LSLTGIAGADGLAMAKGGDVGKPAVKSRLAEYMARFT